MKNEKRFVITPHADIELGIDRSELEYFLTFPDSGINSDTGLILFISGFGSKADSVYERDKLRPYLADKYNCIAVGVNYFGIGNRLDTGATYDNDENFIKRVHDTYNIDLMNYVSNGGLDFDLFMNDLRKGGVTKLDPNCMMHLKIAKDEYQSFGFLPAVDHLQVLGEILKMYKLNKKKIMAFGTSYGGYIALLLGKFAPNTFSIIIDNSGFVGTELAYLSGQEILVPEEHMRHDKSLIFLPFATKNPWTVKDKASPSYFSESNDCIRSLLKEDHFARSEAEYHIFHSVKDLIVSIQNKDRFVDILKKKSIPHYYKKIDNDDLDGRAFKNLDHGMSASLRGIFDLVARSRSGDLNKNSATTDFDLQSAHVFNCDEKAYRFQFDDKFNINVELKGRCAGIQM